MNALDTFWNPFNASGQRKTTELAQAIVRQHCAGKFPDGKSVMRPKVLKAPEQPIE